MFVPSIFTPNTKSLLNGKFDTMLRLFKCLNYFRRILGILRFQSHAIAPYMNFDMRDCNRCCSKPSR